jgi:hypothetical protein
MLARIDFGYCGRLADGNLVERHVVSAPGARARDRDDDSARRFAGSSVVDNHYQYPEAKQVSDASFFLLGEGPSKRKTKRLAGEKRRNACAVAPL